MKKNLIFPSLASFQSKFSLLNCSLSQKQKYCRHLLQRFQLLNMHLYSLKGFYDILNTQSKCMKQFFKKRNVFSFINFRTLNSESYDFDETEFLDNPVSHTPVMVNEVVENINLKEGNMFLDMTFGTGGHSSELLKKIPGLKVIAVDRDPVAFELAKKLRDIYPDKVCPLLGKFSVLPKILDEEGILENSIDGVLFDLGCSSVQLDTAERGFSVSKDGPLDMRMDGPNTPNQFTAANLIAYLTEEELYKILKIYGNEKRAHKIAKAIVGLRTAFKPPTTTRELCNLIETVCFGVSKGNNENIGLKTFQALRIFVNNEINELDYGLKIVHKYLKNGGRAVVISYNTLEDSVVKRHFHNIYVKDDKNPLPLGLFDCGKYYDLKEMSDIEKKFWQPLKKKVTLPSDEEICRNPRSRLAKLRAAIKV